MTGASRVKAALFHAREPFNAYSHLAAALAAVIGTGFILLSASGNLWRQLSLLVYGLSLTLMFSASGTYHMANAGPVGMLRLRKFDHSAIYLLIAGSYTPICLYYFSGFFQWGLLAIVWLIALVGITVKLFVINAPRWVTAGIYILMGWLCVIAVPQMLTRMPGPALAWLTGGGILYTLGAVVYMLKKPDWFPGVFGFHELWHIFVILGSLSQFIVVAAYIAPGK